MMSVYFHSHEIWPWSSGIFFLLIKIRHWCNYDLRVPVLGLNCDLKNCMWLMHLTASAPDVQEPILKYLVHINDIQVLDSVFKPVKCKHH